MRIGTAYMHSATSAQIAKTQADLFATQNELSSGKRVNSPSDDPVSSALISTSRASVSAQDAFSQNHSFLDGELRNLESTLGSVGDAISSAKDAIASANNTTYTNTDRQTVAAGLIATRNQLLTLANTRGSDGQYMFSGFQSGAAPFSQAGSTVSYSGDNGSRGVLVGPSWTIPSNSDGATVFMNIPTGNGVFATAVDPANTGNATIDSGGITNPSLLTGHNYEIRIPASGTYDVYDTTLNTLVSSGTYSSGSAISIAGMRVQLTGTPAIGDKFQINASTSQSVFATLNQAITALQTPVNNDADRAKLTDALRAASSSLDQAYNAALTQRSDVGERMTALDLANQTAQNAKLNGQTRLSDLEDTNYADAASRLASQQTALQAALAAYSKTGAGSLFDFLR
jgi:flagellar hook-associated protein 3 FlgL